ncbi:RnfH family protein [Thalassolituus sp. LLYu03]|uniref:RnfH family protein n=1 Tax=Thalassolituus sp. LLYu03 TaxID=3421656 RepID=UPI003D2722CA
MADVIQVEVAYALPNKQKILTVDVEPGTTMLDAVKQSGIENEFPELDLAEAKFGIFGKATRTPETDVVRAGDRIEIYRPLLIDPKQARANRAAKTAKAD